MGKGDEKGQEPITLENADAFKKKRLQEGSRDPRREMSPYLQVLRGRSLLNLSYGSEYHI